MFENLLKIKNCKLKIGLIGLSIFVFGMLANQANASTTFSKPPYYLSLESGMVAHYTLDGPDTLLNIRDRSSSGNTGNLIHGGSGTTTAPGILGQAMNFDGSNDYVITKTSAESLYDFDRDDPFSISVWLKTDSTSASVQETACKMIDYSPFVGWCWVNNFKCTGGASAGYMSMMLSSDWVGADAACAYTTNPTNINSIRWHHYVMTYSGSTFGSGITFYEDGVALGMTVLQNSLSGSMLNDYAVAIAARSDGSPVYSEFYKGLMDDVRIYNRALDASEVAALYTFGKVRMNSRPHAGAAFTNGLVGHWTLDGADTINNIVDQSGQGNTGLLSHGGSGTTTSPGVLGQALSFDGVDDKVDLGEGDNLSENLASFSVSCWIKRGDTSHNGCIRQALVFGLKFNQLNQANFNLYNGATYINATTAQTYSTQWHHLVGVYDGQYINIYVDGLYKNQASFSGNTNSHANNVELGRETSYSDPFIGSLDDVRIYNRALSATEIYQLYKLGQDKIATTPVDKLNGLVGHWTFDGPDLLQNVRDRSSQGNKGLFIPGASGNTSTTTAPGKIGQALSFDGVDDKVAVDDSSSLDLTNFTISMWFKRKGTGTVGGFAGCFSNGVEFLTSKGLGGGDNTGIDSSWALGVVQSTATLAACFEGTTGTDYILSAGATTILDNRWYHVALTHTAASTVVYLDAVVDASTGTTANPANNNIKVGIGYGTEGASSAADGLFNGLIDDVRIYNRALSAAEVLQLYNLGK